MLVAFKVPHQKVVDGMADVLVICFVQVVSLPYFSYVCLSRSCALELFVELCCERIYYPEEVACFAGGHRARSLFKLLQGGLS